MPYWILQRIDDVDLCAVVLGESWLAAFSDSAREVFAEAARIEWALNDGLDLYVRGSDRQLRRPAPRPGPRVGEGRS